MVDTTSLLRTGRALDDYQKVRAHSEFLAAPLSPEDQLVQSMPDVSPTKWHLAHTSWFFETFLLRKYLPGYRPFRADFDKIFNSYYNSIGQQFPRDRRGVLSRPSHQEVQDYRSYVDTNMATLLGHEQEASASRTITELSSTIQQLVELGLHHEKQHQELLLTDIKHVLFQNPLYPAYRPEPVVSQVASRTALPLSFLEFRGGIQEFGQKGDAFHFDNEGPNHRALLDDFKLANRPISNGEVLEFIHAGGYDEPLLWLSDGWNFCKTNALKCPLYWLMSDDGNINQFSLHGLHPLNPAESASHLSFFEADAIARFFQARLPSEYEWEFAARQQTFVDVTFNSRCIRPGAAVEMEGSGLRQLFGGVWEWTQSPYVAYPGFQASSDAVGEYNGKFMHNQMVLRGGSCATPEKHLRVTYRNFFPSHAQWQVSGARLARGVRP